MVASGDAVPPIPLETDWQPIEGVWAALATDGVGHHDGSGEYLLQIPVEDFGELLFLGGEARFEASGIDPRTVFPLPTVVPATTVDLRFNVCAEGRTGYVILVEGLQARSSSPPHLLLFLLSSTPPHLAASSPLLRLLTSPPPPHLRLLLTSREETGGGLGYKGMRVEGGREEERGEEV